MASSVSGPDDAPWVRPAADGCVLQVHARPGAARSAIAGAHAGALAVRLAARPVEGAANRALVALLAERLGVRPGAITIESGAHARAKRVHVAGVDPATARARLAAS